VPLARVQSMSRSHLSDLVISGRACMLSSRGPEGPWQGRTSLQVPKSLMAMRRAGPRSRMGYGVRTRSPRQLRRTTAAAPTVIDDRRVIARSILAVSLRRADRDASASSASIALANASTTAGLRETRRRAAWVRQRSHVLRGVQGLSSRCSEELPDASRCPVRNRSAPRSRTHLGPPEGGPRPAPEPDRPEAPRLPAGSDASPRRAPRRENRRASREAWKGRFEPPSPGFPPLRRLLNECSHLRRACLTRLRCASRFSQPLDAFLRPRPLGLVSCRFRPWGSCSQRFPPPSSRHDFRRALSPGWASPLSRRRSGPRDSCTWEVRSHRGGFTRIRWPSLSQRSAPSRKSPSSLDPGLYRGLLSWASPRR
jgi:hypothetical protein